MQEHQHHCIITEVTEQEISQIENELIRHAKHALVNAYAPYSNFKVGAAMLFDDGQIYIGSNQENAAYPSGLCAERVVLFYAGSLFPQKKIVAIAITTANDAHEPAAPCGACRQAMIEYEMKQQSAIKIFMASASGKIYLSESVENLLPMVFKLSL